MTKRHGSKRQSFRVELAITPRQPRILLAEDDDDMRRLLAGALRMDGFDVIEARSGAELAESIGSLLLRPHDDDAVDLIITDNRMPWTTGLTVLADLRRSNWNTPVIVITAFGDEETHAEAKRLGALLFDKPFDVDDLRTAAFHLASG